MALGSSIIALACFAVAARADDVISVYPARVNPEQHPRFNRTRTRPPTWATFYNATQFATLRGFQQAADYTILNYVNTTEQYLPLGTVFWPVWQTIFASNFAEVMSYLALQNITVTDLWGFVPGSGPGEEMWQAFTPPQQNLDAASAILGGELPKF